MSRRRSTFLCPSGPISDPYRKHLHVVLTDLFGKASQVLVTSIASIRSKKYDDTCILEPGEHPFLRHHSYVLYRATRLLEVQRIKQRLKSLEFIPQDDVSEEVYKRIVFGLFESKATPQFAKTTMRDIGLTP